MIHDRDVAHIAQPLRPLGLAVSWVVRNDHFKMARQLVVKVEPLRAADVVMQHQQRPPAAGAREMQL